MTDPAAAAARARWRTAEDRLYPALLADPQSYQRGLAAVQAVLAELRRRAPDLSGLLTADAAPDELVATACPAGSAVPAELLVGVACRMRDRELQAHEDARRREDAVRAARAAGRAWAVLAGPADPAELATPPDLTGTGGRWQALHLASGTVLEAAVDPWSRDAPFTLTVLPGPTHTFTDRETWQAALTRLTSEIETDERPQDA